MHSNRSTRAKGFTLIELMIVVAIVAILASVAYPSYVQYIVRSNRAAAEGYMLEVSGLQQRYLLDARSYAADMATLGATAPTTVSPNYTITTTAPTATTFLVTATPVSGSSQATRDTNCGTLTIDQAGAKTASGSGGADKCWQQ
jgi:type IV pilus assembly protein PilE